jgi:hypothetical protein
MAVAAEFATLLLGWLTASGSDSLIATFERKLGQVLGTGGSRSTSAESA